MEVNIRGKHHTADLRHLLPVVSGVPRILREQHRVVLRPNLQLIMEDVSPDVLQAFPIGHNAVLDRVGQGQILPVGLSVLTDVAVLHPNHPLMDKANISGTLGFKSHSNR